MVNITKYTREYIVTELDTLLDALKSNKDIVYLGELFEDKEYSRQRFSEWLTDYKEDKEIQSKADTIKEALETRAVKGAITNKLNSTFTIFHLKNNFDWKDKSEVENTNLNINKDVTKMTDDELEAYIKSV